MTPLGLGVRDLDRATARRLRLPSGMDGVVVTRVDPLSAAYDAGIQRDHIVLEINRRPVSSTEAYNRLARAAHAGDVLAVYVYMPGHRAARDSRDSRRRAAEMKSRILVIDDEAGIRDSMRRTLEYQGYQFVGAATGQEGLALIERDPPDLVFLDIKMPGMDGLEVLERIKAANPGVPVVMVSGHGTAQNAFEARDKGASGFIEKPFSEPVLLERIEKELHLSRTQDENRTYRKEIDSKYQMVGNSPALRKVEDAIKQSGAGARHGAAAGRERRRQGARRADDSSA